MASIIWDDDIGGGVMQNGWAATFGFASPAGRFSAWTPRPGWNKEDAETLDGVGHAFLFAPHADATFTITEIPLSYQGTLARLLRHLDAMRTVTVMTGDEDGHIYTPCQQVPGSPPSVEYDTALRHYTVTFTLRCLDATVTDMLCIYP